MILTKIPFYSMTVAVGLLLAGTPTYAADVMQQLTGTPNPAMSSGEPLRSGATDAARKALMAPAKPAIGGFQLQNPSPMYRERSMQPTVMDAPPAWAQDKLAPAASLVLAPFGANMFQGNFAGTYSDSVNEDYTVMPGDRVAVRIWGAKTFEAVLPVDQQGNIFLPEIGPVKVSGCSNGQLASRVREKVATVFTDNVQVYVNLQSAQPVAVYVTGFVNRPGRYAGAAIDPVMTYLDRAGGIAPDRGTFRNVKVKRGGSVIASFDLYDFVLNGNMRKLRLKDGDVILVGQRGPSVAASGMLRNEARFEFTSRPKGSQLIKYGIPMTTASHASVSGVRNGLPFHRYVSLSELAGMTLADGDSVEFVADVRGHTIMTAVTGAIRGESRFPVASRTRLRSLLAYVQADPDLADTSSVYIRRHSVAEQQKAILQDSLRRLEQSTLTATSQSNEEAQIRIKEAELVHDFVQRAAQLTPDGVVVVSRNGTVSDLLLEDGDEIVIPQKSDVVQVSGEVLLPKAVAFDPRMSADDYVNGAGGLTDHADGDNILIARMNGEVGLLSDLGIHPGDRILVMPKVTFKGMELVKGISQILYQIAVATKCVVGL